MRINKLDGLRGIFSLMVVLFHFQEQFIPSFIYNSVIIRHSNAFVDFFFVLSGFVIALNYYRMNDINQLILFIKKRLIRLYPLVFYTSVLYFIFKVISEMYFPGLRIPEGINTLTNRLIDSLLLTDSTPIFGNALGVNAPNWSISSEVISYFIFGISMLIFKDKEFYKKLFFSIVLLLSGGILFCKGNLFFDGDFGFIRGIYNFSFGYFIYEIYSKITHYHFS